MDKKHIEILEKMYHRFLDDLDVYNGIIMPLTSEYVLKKEDVEKIKEGKTKQERVKILLDILPKRGPRAFEIFHQSLRHQYDWLSEEIDKMLESTPPGFSFNDNLFLYNIQPVSPLTVTREEMVKKLKNSLQELHPNGYIALHGMKGFGKSCLTASTLKDKDLIFKLFNNEVYWIKFGYKRKIDEEILIQMNNLNQQIKNLNSLVLPKEIENFEPFKENSRLIIENHFKDPVHRKALLILDDVCHKEIIDKFDFECKTLVITADIGVLSNRNHIVVTMDHGFTEKETLGLFAKVLDISVDQLPSEAKLIHDSCKGMPLLIAMFAAQFENYKQEMRRGSSGRWEYYLNCLRTKDAKNKVIEEFLKIQETTFDVCIDQLKKEKSMKERYENLAIFSEDVNIMPKTLEILWGEKPYSVDDIMLKFCHKSLAAKKWNDDLKSYIYGVHDLLLCHLKNKLKPDELRDKHKSFINQYREYCNGDFSKLPDDNYSFSYIGHHLEQAELFEEFYDLYMNFDFLQAKINHTGLSDLLIDLKKYRKYITKDYNPIIKSNLQELEKFLESQAKTLAKHRSMKCLDLIQIALNYSEEDFVKKTAKEIAASRNFSLYLTCQINPKNNLFSNFCEEIIKNASTVVFTNEPNHILAGSLDGEIILWDCENRKSKIFHGHNKEFAIKKIILSFNGDYFLALSNDGTLKLFALDENKFISDDISVQSPIHKQTFWKEVFKTVYDDSLNTFSVRDEYITDMKFSQENNKIAGCTNAGTVALWNANGKMEWYDKCKSNRFGGVAFTTADNLLHVMDETISVVRIYKKNQETGYAYVSQFNLQLSNPHIIYFSKHPIEENCLIIVTDKTALYFKWFYNNNNNYIHSYEKYVKIEVKENEDVHYVAATLTYDARYLIIGNSVGIISVMKAFNPDHLITHLKGFVTALDSYYMYYEEFHLICGSERRQINRWKISVDEKPKSVKKLIFDAQMENFGKKDIVALKSYPSIITIYKGKKILTKIESLSGKVVKLKLYDHAKKLIYITESGFVVLYDIDKEVSTKILQLDSIDSFIDILQVQDNFMVVCKGENDQLMVWKNIKISQLIEKSERVVYIKKVIENCVMTVSSEGNIKFWIVENFEWREIYKYFINDVSITHCCLSKSRNFVAVVDKNKKLTVYKMMNDSRKFDLSFYTICEYKENINISKFSEDDKYIAIALNNGDIYVIDLLELETLGKLSLHSCSINQLDWSPISISSHILLSVNGDELAWWNVSFLKTYDKNKNRRSRMGVKRRSNTTLSPNSSLNSMLPGQNSEIEMETSIPSHNIDNYWSRKLPKNFDAERPALLACVQLPSSCTGQIKVCISDDFSKFLTVDIHGAIINYTLFNNSEL